LLRWAFLHVVGLRDGVSGTSRSSLRERFLPAAGVPLQEADHGKRQPDETLPSECDEAKRESERFARIGQQATSERRRTGSQRHGRLERALL
jgi:hypothetical protein